MDGKDIALIIGTLIVAVGLISAFGRAAISAYLKKSQEFETVKSQRVTDSMQSLQKTVDTLTRQLVETQKDLAMMSRTFTERTHALEIVVAAHAENLKQLAVEQTKVLEFVEKSFRHFAGQKPTSPESEVVRIGNESFLVRTKKPPTRG